jgi:hypothetical protein
MSIKLFGDLTGLPETGRQTVRRQEKDCLVAATITRLTGGGGDREVGPSGGSDLAVGWRGR